MEDDSTSSATSHDSMPKHSIMPCTTPLMLLFRNEDVGSMEFCSIIASALSHTLMHTSSLNRSTGEHGTTLPEASILDDDWKKLSMGFALASSLVCPAACVRGPRRIGRTALRWPSCCSSRMMVHSRRTLSTSLQERKDSMLTMAPSDTMGSATVDAQSAAPNSSLKFWPASNRLRSKKTSTARSPTISLDRRRKRDAASS
mmetsp:Transcript_41505/g.101836  ORF Transcript_41505/g.101836 Transcript_41505/m.101836 type:complete len:201 (+) Transcript_41505:372-974(+)